MFKVDEDLTIHLTRGDILTVSVSADEGASAYIFKDGDKVRFKVFERKNCDNVVLQKDFDAEPDTAEVVVRLMGDETKIGEYISKPKEYWYEIELNPETYPQTIIGYDEDGPKVLILYPEGGDYND